MMIVPFLVAPTAVERASGTLAQCLDGARNTRQIRQLCVVRNEWSILSLVFAAFSFSSLKDTFFFMDPLAVLLLLSH